MLLLEILFIFAVAMGNRNRAYKKKMPGLAVPTIPLTVVLAYQYDMAYGNKLERIRAEAEK